MQQVVCHGRCGVRTARGGVLGHWGGACQGTVGGKVAGSRGAGERGGAMAVCKEAVAVPGTGMRCRAVQGVRQQGGDGVPWR